MLIAAISFDQRSLLRRLAELQYTRNDYGGLSAGQLSGPWLMLIEHLPKRKSDLEAIRIELF